MTTQSAIRSNRNTRGSGNLVVERLGYAGPERSGNLSGYLLGEIAEFFGLRDHRIELLARMFGRHPNEIRRGFHPHQLLGVFKGGVGIGAGDLDELEGNCSRLCVGLTRVFGIERIAGG